MVTRLQSGRVALALALVPLVALTPAAAVGRQADADRELADHLKTLRAEFFAAQEKGDRVVLDRVLAPGFTFSHSTGRVETRDDFITRLVSTPNRPAGDHDFTEDQIRVYGGDTVIWLTRSVRRGGMAGDLHFRSTDVLVKSDGAWRWVAVHSTRLPEGAK